MEDGRSACFDGVIEVVDVGEEACGGGDGLAAGAVILPINGYRITAMDGGPEPPHHGRFFNLYHYRLFLHVRVLVEGFPIDSPLLWRFRRMFCCGLPFSVFRVALCGTAAFDWYQVQLSLPLVEGGF